MKQLTTAGLALSAVFAASGDVRAYVNYPWCVYGDTRGMDCVFSTKEQCAEDGRGRGFGTQCRLNPNYDPRLPSVIERIPAKPPGQTGPIPVQQTRHKSRGY
jgi:Protein of unknown function (DUF3551)